MKNDTSHVLNDDRIGRLLFKMSLPAFVGLFVMAMYNVVDAIFIGHFVGSLGIAALAIVFPIQMLAMGIGHMVGMGGASLISRQIGANDIRGAEKALGNSIMSTLVLSAVIMVVGLWKIDWCLTLLGASEAILPFARDYLRIILIGLFFQSFGMLFNNLIRAEGNARIPMTGMLIGAGLNTVFCALFIISLHMGIKGAALATVIGEMVSVLYFVYYYSGKKSFLKFHAKNLAPDLKILKEIFSIGIAAFTMSIASSISAMFVNRICITYGGDTAVSVFGISNRIFMFALMPGIVIAQGLQPILGFNYGARRFDRVIRSITIAIAFATAFSTLCFACIFFFPQVIVKVFTTDAELIIMSGYAMKRMFAGAFLIGFIFVGTTLFQAIGKAVQSFITSVARVTLFFIPLVLILPRYFRLDGIWWAFSISDGLSFLLTMAFFIPQLQQFRKERAYQRVLLNQAGGEG